jgi:CheY-like chemotaxis protein
MSVLNDILDFSMIEAGKMELREESCRVSGLIDEVTELFAARAELRGVHLISKVEADVPARVEADTERVRQVLSNLVGNAVKFTESGTITVRASVEAHKGHLFQLRFEVSDSGMGIETELQNKLFEAFSQGDGSLTRRHGGTGLGLAICKQLVVLMKGQIGVESVPGQGSTFWFVLPLRGLESAGNLELPVGLSTRPLASPPSSKDGVTRKILAAEDNPINQEVIREVLTELGGAHPGLTLLAISGHAPPAEMPAHAKTTQHHRKNGNDGNRRDQVLPHKHNRITQTLSNSITLE